LTAPRRITAQRGVRCKNLQRGDFRPTRRLRQRNEKKYGDHPKNGTIRKAKDAIQEQFEKAKTEFGELGGWKGFTSGEWFLALVRAAFRAYYEKAHYEYFKAKLPEDRNPTSERKTELKKGVAAAETLNCAKIGLRVPA
jgi:hypothetical protein